MQKNTTLAIAVVIALLLGFGAGYMVQENKIGDNINYYSPTTGAHVMPDGTIMTNNGMSMSTMMASMNTALAGKTDDEFDKAFLAEMIVHHQGAVEMAELALTNAKHQEVKNLAGAIIAAQNKEIADMQSWQKSWYNQ